MGEFDLVKSCLSKVLALWRLNSDPFPDTAQMRRRIETDFFERGGCFFAGSFALVAQVFRQNREDKRCRGPFAFGTGDMDSMQRIEVGGLDRRP